MIYLMRSKISYVTPKDKRDKREMSEINCRLIDIFTF
jgi:hypothetical protein